MKYTRGLSDLYVLVEKSLRHRFLKMGSCVITAIELKYVPNNKLNFLHQIRTIFRCFWKTKIVLLHWAKKLDQRISFEIKKIHVSTFSSTRNFRVETQCSSSLINVYILASDAVQFLWHTEQFWPLNSCCALQLIEQLQWCDELSWKSVKTPLWNLARFETNENLQFLNLDLVWQKEIIMIGQVFFNHTTVDRLTNSEKNPTLLFSCHFFLRSSEIANWLKRKILKLIKGVETNSLTGRGQISWALTFPQTSHRMLSLPWTVDCDLSSNLSLLWGFRWPTETSIRQIQTISQTEWRG